MNDLRSQGLYPIETVAKLLNLSERRIEQLAKKKIIPKAGRGIFDLRATVEAYVRYLQARLFYTVQTEAEKFNNEYRKKIRKGRK